MNKFQPTLDKAPFALKSIREDDRRNIIDLLDAVRGKKALVLESHFVQPLSLIIDALALKEHGVEMFCILEDQQPSVISAFLDKDIHHIIYLIHSNIPSIQSVISHITMCKNEKNRLEFTILNMPRMMKTCELLLDRAGVLGDVSLRGCPVCWIPLDEDVISLEYPHAFKELSVDNNTSCLFNLARALTSLQTTRGTIPHIKGKGQWSSTVFKIMSRLRKESGSNAPAPSTQDDTSSIDTLILLDRSIDMVSPMCTQLTYEGLLDEIAGVNCGQLRTTAAGTPHSQGEKKVYGLSSADGVFAETRDRFYLNARKWLNETLRSIQHFRDAGMSSADIPKLKGFVADLRDKFARIPLHTSLIEHLGDALKAPVFAVRQRIEAALLNEQDDIESIQDMIHSGEGACAVLRLLCLYCAMHGGVPKKHYDWLRRDLLNTYGSHHLLTLQSLHSAGLVQRREGRRASVPMVKSPFKLLMQEGEGIDDAEPSDIHFVYAGYAPLSVRIVQHALSKGGWRKVEGAMSALPGKQFEVLQAVDVDSGLPIEKDESGMSLLQQDATNTKRRNVMVCFIGGVTYAEISALRFLSRKELCDCNFIVATTKMENGNTLISSLIP